ncbi:MAG TPA: PilZ domain-containing protein, partial [Gammaproteobacteria bacterium]|nr:PilZ domain-containing protein [Gammaproteobacteria bacterium]
MIQPYNQFEERRKYPRVVMGKPVTVHYNGDHIDAEIHDISADGIQVRCDRKSFQVIHPSGRFIRRENAPIVDISFRLAINGQLNDVKVRGLLYYFVVLSNAGDRDIAFGLRFISMDDI